MGKSVGVWPILIVVCSGGMVLGAATTQESAAPRSAATTRPGMTINQIMGRAYNGSAALEVKVGNGTASDAEKQQFLDYSRALQVAPAPRRGNAADWKKRMDEIMAASEKAVKGEDGAAAEVKKTAGDCRGCHGIFR